MHAGLQLFWFVWFNTLLLSTLSRRDWSVRYPWLVLACLVPPTIAGFLAGTRPRWQGPSELRVARLQAVPLGDAFTSAERATLASVLLLTLTAGFVGLREFSAPPVWFAVWPTAVLLASALWRQIAKACMGQPSGQAGRDL
ncbi:MAG TPA: hypothetical protein VME46_19730 [Acidimicrobiales bacterium]|nr:hypothetical protein [Acidimicrobiales bacterium]